jgi:hypothetical protein
VLERKCLIFCGFLEPQTQQISVFLAPADHQEIFVPFPANGRGTCSNADSGVYVDSHDPSTSENTYSTYRNPNLVYPHRSINKCTPLLPLPHPQPLPRKPDSIPYTFLINSVYLPSNLDEYITSNAVSREEILEIEYVQSVLPPKWQARWTQDDWVGGVSVQETGVLTGGCDGVVRVWDWGGNIVSKGKSGEGALRPVNV